MANKKGAGKDVVVWVRLPRGASINKIKEFAHASGVCHGGDTCICAPVFTEQAGIVLQGKGLQFGEMIKEAGLQPSAACFGGDTCIV